MTFEEFIYYLAVPPFQDTEEVNSWVSRSARNKLPDMHRLESTADLLPALDKLHEFIQLMQGDFEKRNTACRVYLQIIKQINNLHLKMDQKDKSANSLCFFSLVYLTLLKERARVTSTGSTAASSFLLVSVTF